MGNYLTNCAGKKLLAAGGCSTEESQSKAFWHPRFLINVPEYLLDYVFPVLKALGDDAQVRLARCDICFEDVRDGLCPNPASFLKRRHLARLCHQPHQPIIT